MRTATRIAATLAAACIGVAAAECRLIRIAEWPVRIVDNLPFVDGWIDGKPVDVLLDTGATMSVLDRGAAIRLDLPRHDAPGYMVRGAGGVSHAEAARIREFRIGDASRLDWRVLVTGERPRPWAFVLGDDFFENVDLELDLPNRVVRLFQPEGCRGVRLAYWAQATAVEVPLDPGADIRFPVEVNGRRMRALLDTGASLSVLTLGAAANAGVTSRSPRAQAAGCVGGVGGRVANMWVAPFESVAIGAQTIHEPTLHFSDLWAQSRPPMGNRVRAAAETVDFLLGMDFLQAHRVLVSRSQGKLYFTYSGGRVFPAMQGAPCESPPKESRDARPNGEGGP